MLLHPHEGFYANNVYYKVACALKKVQCHLVDDEEKVLKVRGICYGFTIKKVMTQAQSRELEIP